MRKEVNSILRFAKAEIYFPSNSVKLKILPQNHPVFKKIFQFWNSFRFIESSHSILAPFLRA